LIKAILTDIEGTTSSLSFVKEVLFPYAEDRIREFVLTNSDHKEVAKALTTVSELCDASLSIEQAIQQLIKWTKADKKVTPLKDIQGLIWESGYASGDFFGHIYEDAFRNLSLWKSRGVDINVFSSGSVKAQKLLFSHTHYGDLSSLFSGFYDTNMGAKQSDSAYFRITEDMGFTPTEVLFLSDVISELDAAEQAGLDTILLARDLGGPPTSTHHKVAKSFDEVIL
jgi:enolase-phosphatase E1